MDSSIFSTSSKLSYARLLLFLSSFFYLSVVSITATDRLSYVHNCGSVVHESEPGNEEFNISPFPERQNGYYSGGDKVLNLSSVDHYYPPEYKVLVFETHHVYKTDVDDVFKVEGSLIFQTSFEYDRSFNFDGTIYYSSDSSNRGVLDFDFQGFWSTTTGKLCMVGSSYTYSKDGKLLHLQAVLKLNNIKDSSSITTLVTGTMDSLHPANEPNHFDQISLLMFPQISYKYTKVPKGCPGGTDNPDKSSLGLSLTRTICNMLSGRGYTFELDYASGCDSAKSCNPFGDVIGYLPRFLSFSSIPYCSEDKQSLRFLIQFSNISYMAYYSSFNLSTSLVGEGFWDAKKNRFCAVACRIFDASGDSLEKSHVGDCSTRLSLRFPAVLSIRNTSTVVGEIWSEKQRNESSFFDKIMFRNTHHRRGGIQLKGLKYKYTETDKVKKLCPPKKNSTGNSRGKYPDASSSGRMSFSVSIKNSKGGTSWGSSDILAVGDQPYQRFPSLIPSSSSRPLNRGIESDAIHSMLNISYIISLTLNSNVNPLNQSSEENQEHLQISAEGFYDAEAGNLCMVGCRDLRSENKASLTHSMDCEMIVEIKFPPSNSDRKNREIKGSIKSMREETDPIYLGPIHFTGNAYYSSWAMDSIWIMDFEVIIFVVSNTLAIIFVALQIFHVRRHPGVRPFISILMLAILALALSRFFYIGITLVRLVPNGYALYREHNYVDVDDTYIYADPASDYYSTAWDIIIIVLGLFFATIINLQRRFGGHCFLPKRFQESVTYEEHPTGFRRATALEI